MLYKFSDSTRYTRVYIHVSPRAYIYYIHVHVHIK